MIVFITQLSILIHYKETHDELIVRIVNIEPTRSLTITITVVMTTQPTRHHTIHSWHSRHLRSRAQDGERGVNVSLAVSLSNELSGSLCDGRLVHVCPRKRSSLSTPGHVHGSEAARAPDSHQGIGNVHERVPPESSCSTIIVSDGQCKGCRRGFASVRFDLGQVDGAICCYTRHRNLLPCGCTLSAGKRVRVVRAVWAPVNWICGGCCGYASGTKISTE